ncbi:MAG: DUF1932 domain-containing protein [Pseudomonadota bacterium]
MSGNLRIGLIGYGEVGQTLAAQLATTSATLAAYDLQFADANSVPTAAVRDRSSVDESATPIAAVSGRDLIVSAVTAEQCLAAARSVAAGLEPGTWFLDVNSVSPTTKQQAAAVIEAAGGRYVEAAVMSPIQPLGLASPILLGGPHAEPFLAECGSLGLTSASVRSSEIGVAAAAKMCRSVCIKGMEALVTESLLAADFYGVSDDVVASLNNVLPGVDWATHAPYLVSRSVQHGLRRAEEMREVAATLRDAAVEPWMTEACVKRQQWAGLSGCEPTLNESLAALLDMPAVGQGAKNTARGG